MEELMSIRTSRESQMADWRSPIRIIHRKKYMILAAFLSLSVSDLSSPSYKM